MKYALSLLAAVALVAAAPKPSPSPNAPPAITVGVWTVKMTSVDLNFKTGDFSTPKQVTMTRQGGDVTGDRANGNFKTKNATLFGHVVVHDQEGNFAGLSSGAPSSKGPATLTADQVNIDGTAKVYTATGSVHYVQADTTVDADKGVLNDTTHELDLTGKVVHIVQGDRNMQAEHVVYNTITGKAHAEGNVVMQFPSEVNPHFATPKPITIKNPLQKHPSQPASTPAPSPSPRA